MKGFHVFILFLLIKVIYSWDNEELELFDLVEEVNSNFYGEFGVKSDADVSEIKKAYRKLSLQYHPDKNKDPGAEVKFRQLVAMYEVLKDEERRKKYDQVLEFGLPDWKQPVYYYRKVRKLGLLEMTVILLFIFTIGHFLVIWAAYFEKKFEVEEVFNSRKKKDKRGKKAKLQQALQEEEMELELQRMLSSIPKPSSADLLPFKLTRWIYLGAIGIPSQVQAVRMEWERKKRLQQKREERQRQLEEDAKLGREKRTKRKRVQVLYEKEVCESTEKPVSYTPVQSINEEEEESQELKTDEWNSEDYVLLAKAVGKYPGGTSNRWERIASMLNRDVSEVIAKSKEMKTDFSKPVETAAQGITGTIGENVQIKKGKAISSEISKRSDFVEDIQTTDSSVSVNSKKQKPTKKNKSAERTLMISQTTNISSELSKGAESETSPVENDHSNITQNNKANVVEKKRVSFNTEAESITSDALSKSMKEKTGKVTVDSVECTVGSSGGESWTQNQQKIFEWALTQYPRGVDDRWDKMAQHIPGKSKEDCIIRFKYLAEVIKKKKQLQQQ